jgi:hypothetical protein
MMNRYIPAVRHPVRRPGAEQFLLVMLLSFALSVSLTRLFLELTGYPQLGGGELHIAHMLWGGLLLFAAALLPLVFANRWVYLVGSALAGVGIGLFIDEVGKFITQSNDYFYPAAAPIIYALFLICVLLYLQLNRPPPQEARAEMYTVLEMMEDVLDHDLEAHEKAEIENRLRFVIEQKDRPELARLGQALLEFVTHESIYLAPSTPGYLEKAKVRLLSLEERYLNQIRFRNVLVFGVGALGLVSLVNPILLGYDFFQTGVQAGALQYNLQGYGLALIDWFFRLQVMQGLVGVMLVAGAVLLLSRQEERGIRFSYLGLLIYLTIVNLLLFYYNQFSTIISATIQFILLLGVLYYRQRYSQNA